MGKISLDHLDQRKEAAIYFKEALEADPAHGRAREALDDLAFEIEDWQVILKRFKREIRDVQKSDPERAAALSLRIARGYRKIQKKPAYAIRYCKQALGYCSGDQDALELLEALYQDLSKWEDLADLYEEHATGAEDPEDQVAWLSKLATLYREATRERDREIEILHRILETVPGEADALSRLEQVYRDEQKFGKALEIMEQRLETIGDLDEKKDLLRSMALLADEELRSPQKAADYYGRILSLDPDDLEAAKALTPIHEESGNWEPLIDCLRIQFSHTEERGEKAELLRRIGDIYSERLSLPKQAFDSYTEAIRANPQDRELAQKLEGLARDIGNWDDMIGLYRGILESTEDDTDRAALLYRVGEIQERELNDPESALTSYQDAEDACNTWPPVLDALQRLYVVDEAWDDLADILARKADQEDRSEEERLALYAELARVREDHLEDLEAAAEALASLLEIEPANVRALDAQERIYRNTERWDDLLGVYRSRIDNPASDDDLKAALHLLGSLYVEKLDQPDEAVKTFQRLRELDPEDLTILVTLEDLYRQLEQWPSLVATCLERVDLLRGIDQKKTILFEVATLQEDRIGDPELAVGTLRRIRDLDEADWQSLDELERILTELEDITGLVGTLRAKVSLSSDPDQKKKLLYGLAEIYEDQVEDSRLAAEAHREILEVDPTELVALRSLQVYHEEEG